MLETVVAVLGGITWDFVIQAERTPCPGESLIGTAFAERPGGKGANIAVSAYRISHTRHGKSHACTDLPANWVKPELGDVSIYLNGAVGADRRGTELLDHLASSGVDVSGIQICHNLKTAVAICITEAGSGQSSGVSFRGAMEMWTMRNRDSVTCMAAGKTPHLVVCQLSVPSNEIYRVLATAMGENIETILNPSPARHLDSTCYRNITHLIMNQVEAETLSGHKMTETPGRPAFTMVGQFFLGLGVKNVIITLAAEGAYFATSKGIEGIVNIEKNDNVIDATGAGDTFVGTYAIEHLRQVRRGTENIEIAVRRACNAAAASLRSLGAQESMPWSDECSFVLDNEECL